MLSPALASVVGDWKKIGDYSYTGSVAGTTYHFYQALYYLQVGASMPWHDTWEFPTHVDNISVTNATYRGCTVKYLGDSNPETGVDRDGASQATAAAHAATPR